MERTHNGATWKLPTDFTQMKPVLQTPTGNAVIKLEKIQSSSPTESRPQSVNSHTRKSAWERMQEKYHEKERMQKQSRDKLIGGPEEALLGHHQPCCTRRNILEVFHSKKFVDPKLERLFQRYFFKLNQNSISVFMLLIAAICVLLIVFHYVGGTKMILKGLVLGLAVLILLLLCVLCNRSAFTQMQMSITCYVVMVLLIMVVILATVDTVPRTASEGVFCTLFFIYMAYTLLPIRMRLSVLMGFMLSLTHLICVAAVNHADPFLWKQVSALLLASLHYPLPIKV